MKQKRSKSKIAIIGILALVVLGCVLAAGCTSTTTTVDEKSLLGTWSATTTQNYSNIQYVLDAAADGTGVEYELHDNEYMITYPFTWKLNGDSVIISYGDGDDNTFVGKIEGKTITDADGDTFVKIADALKDDIIGTWVSSKSDEGYTETLIEVFKWDGTGVDLEISGNGTLCKYPFTWKNAGDSYKVTYTDGDSATFTMDSAKKSIVYKDDDGKLKSDTYVNLEYASIEPIIGIWTGEGTDNGEKITYTGMCRADGVGSCVLTSENGSEISYPIIWEKNDEGYLIRFIDGDTLAVTYDSANDKMVYTEDGRIVKFTRESTF